MGRLGVIGFLVIVLSVTGCGAEAKTDSRLRVVTTTGIIADTVRQIAGEYAYVDALMGPGIDPHQYKATPSDLDRLLAANLILYNGLHLEGKLTEVLDEMVKSRSVVAVTQDIPKDHLRTAAPGYEGAHDPHVWFDVRLWKYVTATIRDALVKADPPHADHYRISAEKYLTQLDALHSEVYQQAQSIPAQQRVLITAHDAFYYFGAAYGFQVRGLQGISTASETTTQDIENLANYIGENKIRAVFGESSVPDRSMLAVMSAVEKKYGFRPMLLDEKLYSDALGEPGSSAETYLGMVRHNIAVITKALKP